MFVMTTVEKEARIVGQPYPWQELMEVHRRYRDDRLNNIEAPETTGAIESEYEDALDRILAGLNIA
jgi:hypothetical protein